MNIQEILTDKHFVLKPTTKWVTVNDPRPAFEKAFRTKRFAKLQGACLYVTLGAVKHACETLIAQHGLTVYHLPSTAGNGDTYPGIDTRGVSRTALLALVDAFGAAVDQHLSSTSMRVS